MSLADLDTESLHVERDVEGGTTRIRLVGILNGSLPQELRNRILSLIVPGCHIVLDLSGLTSVSGLGVRMLLLLFRQVRSVGGSIAAKNAPLELLEIAEAAGFLSLFRSDSPACSWPAPLHRPVQGVDAYPTHFHNGHSLRIGNPIPFGATPVTRGINFSVYSKHATSCDLILYDSNNRNSFVEIPFPAEFRIGSMFCMMVFDLDLDHIEYGFRMHGPSDPKRGYRFDPSKILLDPLAVSISGSNQWAAPRDPADPFPFRAHVVTQDFDWEGDRQLGLKAEDLVIYEMHARGFTADPSSGVKHRGTYAGLREKIPYLKDLGVNCVELLPICEFDEQENPRSNPLTGERLWNYWGYSTLAFFAPKAGYAASGRAGMQCDEFKSLVKELHRNGIEVILDVVFNHTAEGNENGPTISFRGLDNSTYYMLTRDGLYQNFSGCGNTFNCNHPVVRELLVDCLRHWVAEYHVDGFRFDLASILGRDETGTPLSNPPLIEALAVDPVLGRTKLIAEAWDAAGLYQVGSFPAYGRWSEWNGRYRDCLRKFLKGDAGHISEMATRVLGSPDLYSGRGTTASINFVTCHDGFTLHDLVSYMEKHNEANGEENRDGGNDNYSWNCGVEGPTNDPAIRRLRMRQMKNALTMLFVSQGVPMITMGDECGRTQQGNNNAYCHDGPINWFDWSLPEQNAELFRFCKFLIEFRKQHSLLRSPLHPGPGAPDIIWHGKRAWNADWSPQSRVLAFQRTAPTASGLDNIYVVLNMHWEGNTFELPATVAGTSWHLFANTSVAAPNDIFAPGSEPPLADQTRLSLVGRSVAILVAR